MKDFVFRFAEVIVSPDTIFNRVRHETGWKMSLFHLLVLCLILPIGSLAAWSAGVRGDSPINASLSVQMELYPFWHDVLLTRFGLWSYPIAFLVMIIGMLLISAVYVPLIYLVFRNLGGKKEPNGLLHAFQAFTYGLTPVMFGGFLPVLGLLTGVYATILQLYRGPSITLQNKSGFSYLLIVAVLAYAIMRYWQGGLL